MLRARLHGASPVEERLDRMKRALSFAALASVLLFALPALADKVAVLPFTSPAGVPPPELEQARAWTREAVSAEGHAAADANELASAEAAVKDGAPDTTQEYVAAGRAAGADWTLTGHVTREDHPPVMLPGGGLEDGYTTYRVELEACQVATGRVESLAREVLPDEGASDVAQMVGLLLRPEGIANAELPWGRGPRRPKARPSAAPPAQRPPAEPTPPRPVYGREHPIALGASIGVSNALTRPAAARGPSWAMPVGVAFGYALADSVPGLELRANVTGQPIGPRAAELSAGARYAIAPLSGLRLFVGPELLVGAHVALGADKTTRLLAHGSAFVAYGITESVQVELAGDLAAALGGSGTLLLGGGTARVLVRF